jgi:hypothetical protein
MQRDVFKPDASIGITRRTCDPGSTWLFQFFSMGMASM